MELRLMLSLDHPNILTLCGARASPPEYYLLFPYQENGSVSRLVHDQRWAPTWGAALILLQEIAAALAYVHARGIVHRDIKPANVLIGADWVARLADFGLAEDEAALRESLQASIYQTEDAEGKAVAGRYVRCRQGTADAPSGGFQKQHMVGTVTYMAPEVLMRRVPSFPADVYAFAILTAETTTGVAPYADRARNVALAHTVLDLSYNEADLAKAIASEGLRPSLPGEAGAAYFGARESEDGDDPLAWAPSAEKLRAAVERGWSADPNARPTFIDVQKDLDAIAAAYRASGGRLARVWRPPREEPSAAATPDELASRVWKTPELAGTYPARFPPMTNEARVCNAGVFSTCGARGADKMEDRHVVCNALEGLRGAHLIGVFDGHRGAECADFASRNIAAALTSTWHAHGDPGEALKEAFTAVDAAFVDAFERDGREGGHPGGSSSGEASRAAAGGIGRRYPGCTACVALVLGDVAYVANAGDCRAVMCVDYAADAHVALTTDHAADTNEDERRRVEAAGGTLRRVAGGRGGGDTWRVGHAGLAVTRAMGDADCKGDGVTALPEVTKVHLTPAHEYLVVACDGIWDVVSNEECVKMIKDTVKEPNMCAKRLGSEALTRMSGDNITVIVAFLKDLATSEKVTWERAFTTNAI